MGIRHQRHHDSTICPLMRETRPPTVRRRVGLTSSAIALAVPVCLVRPASASSLSGSHRIRTLSTIVGVAVSKVSLSLDEQVLSEARARAGRRELSAYVNEAVRRQLQRDRLGELLAEMDSEAGPVPEELLTEARQIWLANDKQPRRTA